MMSTAVEIFYRNNTEMRKALLKFSEFIAGEYIIFPALRTPRHDQIILASSPNLRPRARSKTARGLRGENLLAALVLNMSSKLWLRAKAKRGDGNLDC
jgi:hypothetical protein